MTHERFPKGGQGQNETANQLPILSLPLESYPVERSRQKRIALFTSGRDRHGMNAAVRAFVRYEFSY